MAEYTITRNERFKDKEIHLDFNGFKVISFNGQTTTAELTEDQVTYLQNHGWNVAAVTEE